MSKWAGVLIVASGVLASGAQAVEIKFLGDSEHGRQLYDQKCMGCHVLKEVLVDAGKGVVHDVRSGIVRNPADLLKQVLFCNHLTKAGFTAQESEDVGTYLNSEVYKLDEQMKKLQRRIEELEAQKKGAR